ncbi:hypothetical protein Caci_5116 [Catenulispora acidiphila DSM 44928]|uniref:Uncharacterized protein n=1 Tax=Catenulispora acidiphila (strain DSM 44928 / JCM 14897 / NBRC 102108 / NRRL B-24433 / ID139908) TaxID=479433 RepID=C7Q527_CATAD|nr:hypothetical protein [Catenulispora acidiphila]ACU73975.1 hypothetical protein Caci_5116 [Catenulispora acidiphila DSM 44928]
MNRGPNLRRYWSSLTGLGRGPAPERNWRGKPFWRRYLASFFVLPQPPEELDADGASISEGARTPRLRYQSMVLAGAAVLAVVAVSVTQFGGGSPGNDTTGTGSDHGASSSHPTSPTTSSSGPSTPTTSPTKPGPWAGTIRVAMNGERVTSGPPPGAGLVFGLAVGGQGVLVGPGNLVAWTDDASPTAAKCSALLQAHAVYQATVKAGDKLCVAALNGRTASAKVTAEDQNASDGVYIDLEVVAYAPAS